MPTPYRETKGAPSGDTITGSINGSNTEFVLSRTPDQWSVRAFVNGFEQASTVSGTTVTMATAPLTGSLLSVNYTAYSSASADYASVLSLANMALILIGAEMIDAIDDTTPNGKIINNVWAYVRDEVLQARDWKFAKSRVSLTDSGTTPEYNWDFAYSLPTDFLRLVKPRRDISHLRNPASVEAGSTYYYYGPLIQPAAMDFDSPVWPPGIPYIIEALPDGTKVLMTNYDNTDNDIYIDYIRRETDATLYSPTFSSCLIHRLASRIAFPITHDLSLVKEMDAQYIYLKNSAHAVNESMDYLENESGNNTWDRAGRI